MEGFVNFAHYIHPSSWPMMMFGEYLLKVWMHKRKKKKKEEDNKLKKKGQKSFQNCSKH